MDDRSAATRFLELTQHLAAGFAIDGTIHTANDAFATLVGTDPVGHKVRAFTHPEDHGALDEARATLRSGQRRVSAELRMGREPTWRWYAVTASMNPADGSVYAVAEDRTEAHRAQARLAEAEDRFRAAFEDAAIGMSIITLDGRWLRANPAMCALVQRREEELIGLPVSELTHPEDRDATDGAMHRLLTGSSSVSTEEKRYLRPDGSAVWVLRTASLVREGDQPRYFLGQVIDITQRRAAEDALRASEERFRTLAASAPAGVWWAGLEGELRYANDRLCEITGRSAAELQGFGWLACLPDAVPVQRVPALRDLVIDAGADGREFAISTPAGLRWVRARAGLMYGADGAPEAVAGTLEDVTEQVRNIGELAAREQELRLLTERSSDFLARLSPTYEFRYASPACQSLIGYEPEQLVGHDARDLVLEEDLPALRQAAEELRDSDTVTVVCRVRRMDGEIAWFESTLAPIRDELGRLTELVCVSRDVTERKSAELQLAHQAMHDALTGLPNRTLFLDRLAHALRRRRRGGTGVLAVLFFDVDRFKVVNDSLGHAVGDRLLVDVAARVDAALRPADTVARFGGDEFTVLCEDIAGELEAVAIAQRLVDLFDEPFDIDGREVFLSTSVGIALASGSATGRSTDRPDDLIRDADAAMYRAKELGKARYELFDTAMRTQALHRLELENALRRAVERDELRLHLQPEIAVESGAIVGFEALVRWEHPERGLLGPGDFVSLAEETGLIGAVGAWVLRQACALAASWATPGLLISVNVSARQLAGGDFTDLVATVLAETGLPADMLCLELTESAVVEHGAMATLEGLKRLGVRLAIDDFGTGWSSLGHLRRFPIDIVKLDRSFVSGLGREPQDASVAAAIISLAHALGLSTVAEGIETGEQLAVLAALGCDLGQGYLFARPAPAETFGDVVASSV
jgi:diguanylate cyclase (GGDEF)-like protein/PAS domain S-box-containing protein